MQRKLQMMLAIAVCFGTGCLQVNAQPQADNSSLAPAKDSVNLDPLSSYKKAGINEKQEGEIMALIKSFESLMIEKGKLMQDLMSQMRQISLKPDLDEQAALSKQGEINTLNAEMAVERIKLLAKLRAVLTPEQRQKFVKLL